MLPMAPKTGDTTLIYLGAKKLAAKNMIPLSELCPNCGGFKDPERPCENCEWDREFEAVLAFREARVAGEVSSGEKYCVNHPDREAVWFPFTDVKERTLLRLLCQRPSGGDRVLSRKWKVGLVIETVENVTQAEIVDALVHTLGSSRCQKFFERYQIGQGEEDVREIFPSAGAWIR